MPLRQSSGCSLSCTSARREEPLPIVRGDYRHKARTASPARHASVCPARMRSEFVTGRPRHSPEAYVSRITKSSGERPRAMCRSCLSKGGLRTPATRIRSPPRCREKSYAPADACHNALILARCRHSACSHCCQARYRYSNGAPHLRQAAMTGGTCLAIQLVKVAANQQHVGLLCLASRRTRSQSSSLQQAL